MAALLGLSVAAFAAPALADDCGCGGPKAYYAQRYGTVKPPQFNLLPGTTTLAPAPATGTTAAPAGTATTTPVNPPATGSGG